MNQIMNNFFMVISSDFSIIPIEWYKNCISLKTFVGTYILDDAWINESRIRGTHY